MRHIVVAIFTSEPGSLLAVEDHQLGQAGGIADRFLVVGDGALGLGVRFALVCVHVGTKPAVDGFLVWLQHVIAHAQAEAGMKEHLVGFVRSVKILNQALPTRLTPTGEFVQIP